MNTNRLLLGLGVAVLMGLLMSTFVYRLFKRSEARPTVMGTLVVADVAMPLGTRVDATNLKVIAWPVGQSVAGMFTRIEDCANRALITPVAANEPILDSKLAPKEAGAGLSATIPQGMRGVSVAVNEVVGVAGFVTPGTIVDVLVTGKMGGAEQRGGAAENITKTILENVRVLAAGQKVEQDREGKPQTVPVVTLLVTPDEATKLTMASTQGKIQLALRNTIDSKKTDPAPVLQAALFAPAGAVNPPKKSFAKKVTPSAPSPYVVEVIVGTKRENKSFPNPGAQQ